MSRAQLIQLAGSALRGARGGHRIAMLHIEVSSDEPADPGHRRAIRAAIAARIRSQVRHGDTLGRLSTDSFGLLSSGLPSEITAVAHRISAALHEPISSGPFVALVDPLIGIAFARPGQMDARALLEAAQHAARRERHQARSVPPPMAEADQRVCDAATLARTIDRIHRATLLVSALHDERDPAQAAQIDHAIDELDAILTDLRPPLMHALGHVTPRRTPTSGHPPAP